MAARDQAVRLNQLRMLLAMDRGVGHVLRVTGRIHDTLLVFSSDNGHLWGDHRLLGKEEPYERSLEVPLILRDDALTAGGTTPTGSR